MRKFISLSCWLIGGLSFGGSAVLDAFRHDWNHAAVAVGGLAWVWAAGAWRRAAIERPR